MNRGDIVGSHILDYLVSTPPLPFLSSSILSLASNLATYPLKELSKKLSHLYIGISREYIKGTMRIIKFMNLHKWVGYPWLPLHLIIVTISFFVFCLICPHLLPFLLQFPFLFLPSSCIMILLIQLRLLAIA